MPRKAHEILKARGYTDEELRGLPLLNDPRFVATLEAEDADREALQTQRDQLQRTVDDTGRWYHETAKPTMAKAMKDTVEARAEAARLRAQLEAEQDLGLRQVANDQDRNRGNANGNDGNRNDNGNTDRTQDRNMDIDHRYVSADTFTKFVEQSGAGIEMATDIIEDHRELFGGRLPGGISKLREDYRNAVRVNHFSGNLRDYWEQQYKVGDKRAELSAAAAAAHDKSVGDAAVQAYISEHGTPFTRPLQSSNNPFTKKSTGTDGRTVESARRPWESASPEQRHSARVVKMATKVLSGGGA